ncbi:MAG: MarR family transcriptional regulator [Pelagimonas sp.]|jgi:DNA-binding MarR family transcriptional regulator|nr:MarR family transcriptional regulator [Pelagimonas sp.]
MTETPETARLGKIGLDNFAPYLMNRIMGRYNASLREEMTDLGLTVPKMRVIAILAVMDGLLIGELTVYAVVEYSTLSRTLDGLEKDGLVRRSPDPDDQRATRIHLTDAGRETFEQLWPSMANAHAQMFQGIEDDEHRAFVGTLTKILKNIRKHDF